MVSGASKAAVFILMFAASRACPVRPQTRPPASGQDEYLRAESLVRSHSWSEGLDVLKRR
jgi:hypothetical protein